MPEKSTVTYTQASAYSSDWFGVLILTLPSLFWAGNFVFGRAVHDLLPPFTLSFSRWLIATIILLPFIWKYLKTGKTLYWQYR